MFAVNNMIDYIGFQSAPPCGERPASANMDRQERQFQSAPPCGERLTNCRRLTIDDRFQSAPPCGERPSAEVD